MYYMIERCIIYGKLYCLCDRQRVTMECRRAFLYMQLEGGIKYGSVWTEGGIRCGSRIKNEQHMDSVICSLKADEQRYI